jgi:hypothetical protein
VTEKKGKLDEEEILCPALIRVPSPGNKPCEKPAHRRPAYLSTGVIFPGTGFTRTVIPPAPPKPPSRPELTPDEHFEAMDKFAEDQYKDEVNVRPERDKVIEKARKDASEGKIF